MMLSNKLKLHLICLGLSLLGMLLYIFYGYIFSYITLFDFSANGVWQSIKQGYATEMLIAAISIVGFLVARPIGYILTLILPLWCVLWISLNISIIGETWVYLLFAIITLLSLLPMTLRKYYGIKNPKQLNICIVVSTVVTVTLFWINKMIFSI